MSFFSSSSSKARKPDCDIDDVEHVIDEDAEEAQYKKALGVDLEVLGDEVKADDVAAAASAAAVLAVELPRLMKAQQLSPDEERDWTTELGLGVTKHDIGGIAPRAYTHDVGELADTLARLQVLNARKDWRNAYSAEFLAAVQADPSIVERFHCRFPCEVQKAWPADEHSHRVLFEYALPTEAMTQLELGAFMAQQKRHASYGGVAVEPHTLYLPIDPRAIERQLARPFGLEDAFGEREAHAFIMNVRLVGGQNTTSTDFDVKLQVPNMAYREGAPGKRFLDLATPHGIRHASDFHRDDLHSLGTDACHMYATLPANLAAGSALDTDVYASSPELGDFNSPEAARWREVDLAAVLEEIDAMAVGPGGQPRSTIRIDAPTTTDEALMPKSLLLFVALAHPGDLRTATARLKAPHDASEMPRVSRSIKTVDGERETRDVIVVNAEAMREVVRHYHALYNATAAGACNLFLTQVALTPRQGARGWLDMSTNGARESMSMMPPRPVHLTLRLEIQFLVWPDRRRISKAEQARLLHPLEAYHRAYVRVMDEFMRTRMEDLKSKYESLASSSAKRLHH